MREDPEAELRRLQKRALRAQFATPFILVITLIVAGIVGFIAFLGYNATRNEYEARARPYAAIHSLEFTRASENTTYVLVRVTNLGDRPATNVGIENISLCALVPIQCTIVPLVAEKQQDTILYPGRLRTTRAEITEDDYQKILDTEVIEVALTYDYGNKLYQYTAWLRLQPDDTWDVEQEQEISVPIK